MPLCADAHASYRALVVLLFSALPVFLGGGILLKKTFRSWSNFFLVKIQNSTNFLQEAVKSKKVDPSGAFGHVPPPSTSSRLFLFLPYSGAIIIVIVVLLRHNGSKTYSSIHTHMDANTSTTNTQKYKNSKRNRTGQTRATLGLLYCAGCQDSGSDVFTILRTTVVKISLFFILL